jgi:hypothetical protein
VNLGRPGKSIFDSNTHQGSKVNVERRLGESDKDHHDRQTRADAQEAIYADRRRQKGGPSSQDNYGHHDPDFEDEMIWAEEHPTEGSGHHAADHQSRSTRSRSP